MKKILCLILIAFMVVSAACASPGSSSSHSETSHDSSKSETEESSVNSSGEIETIKRDDIVQVNMSFWDWDIGTKNDAVELAKYTREMGYTGADLTFRWKTLEYMKGDYDFSYIDEVMDAFAAEGLYLSASLLYWSIGLSKSFTDEIVWQELADGNLYSQGKSRGYTPCISDAHTLGIMTDAYRAFVEHLSERYKEKLMRVHARVSPYGELEYFCDALVNGKREMLDYAAPSMNAFIEYLEAEHGSISTLESNYNVQVPADTFSDLKILDKAEITAKFNFDWQNFRQKEILKFAESIRNIVKEVDPTLPVAVQIGCFWDYSASLFRGVFDPYQVSKYADIIHTDDSPGFEHAFSYDYVAVTDEIEYASEIDGPYQSKVKEEIASGDENLTLYNRQATWGGKCGIKYLNACNYEYSDVIRFKDALGNFVKNFYAAEPMKAAEKDKAILVNTCNFLYQKKDARELLLETYNTLSDNGDRHVRFVTDTQLIENPELLQEIGHLYLGTAAGGYYLRNDLISLLAAQNVQLHTPTRINDVVFYDQYGLSLNTFISGKLLEKLK